MKHIFTYLLIFTIGFCWSQDETRGSKPNAVSSTVTGTKRAVIVGVSDYNSDDLKLNYADNDAALFKNYLKDIEGLKDENISLLINKDAVALNVTLELKKQFNASAEGDILYIYFAGHGDVVDDFGEQEGFLLAADASAKQEYYSGGTIPLDRINTIIKNLSKKGVRVILILDACRSGFTSEKSAQTNMGTIQAMFQNSTKILSCGENELSHEGSDVKHGYFTYYLIKGLANNADINNDASITYRELGDYLYDNVNKVVTEKFNRSQIPVVRTKNDRAILKKVSSNSAVINFEDIASTIDETIALASRSIKTTALEDKTYGSLISKFKSALDRKSYYGKSSSAYEIYKATLEDTSIPEGLKTKMQSSLLTVLSNEAQGLINLYIEGSSVLPPSREFIKQSKHLEICLELMGEDNFLSDRIQASQLLLESYAIIRSNNYSKFERAKRQLNKALKLEPRAAYIHNALGLIFNNQKIYDSAFYHFNKAKSLIKSWESPDINISNSFIDQYRFEEAENHLNNSLGNEGLNANLKLGEISVMKGKYQLAETYFKKAIAENPNNIVALQKMSDLQALKGNSKAAQEWYSKAFQTDSTKLKSSGLLKYIQTNNIPDEAAEKLLLTAIESNPESAIVYFEYAEFISQKYKRLSRLRVADSLYSKAIKLNPYHVTAYAGLGWLKSQLRKPLLAIEAFESGISKNSNNPEAYYNYGNFLNFKLGKTAEAERQYLKALEYSETYGKAYSALVNLYNSEGKSERSISFLTSAIEKLPNTPDLWYLLGQTHFNTKNYSEAISAYEKANSIDASFVKGNKNLGYSQVETNQLEGAESSLLSASEFSVDNKVTTEIVEYLLNTAKDKLKFGTKSDTEKLYKLAFDIDKTAKTGIVYAQFLYLNANPEEAAKIALPMISKENSKTQNADLLKILTKASIDLGNIENTDYYYNLLTQIERTTDYLLASVYFNFKGNNSQSDAMRRKVDQTLFRSNKLKEMYSANTIEKFILN
ncbi:tetratricopeptide repeat protein [Winogradskyella tangerina]|uniref:tetratricopeptide repeat protein n=1 Tax=Winogradskyella tangerina TaxID=2023240 RepID=UPI0018E55188|nr:tetratricopeptide repeat protein [Winogradskyella tangerina]